MLSSSQITHHGAIALERLKALFPKTKLKFKT